MLEGKRTQKFRVSRYNAPQCKYVRISLSLRTVARVCVVGEALLFAEVLPKAFGLIVKGSLGPLDTEANVNKSLRLFRKLRTFQVEVLMAYMLF